LRSARFHIEHQLSQPADALTLAGKAEQMLVSCKATDCNIQFAANLSRCPICGEHRPAIPDVNPVKSRSRRTAKLVAFTLVLALAAMGPFRFSWFSICSQCGAVRNSSQRQLPFVNVTYWTSHNTVETPLSQVAATFIPQHEHNWIFGHGGGNSVMCALGPAGAMRRFTSDSDIVHFLVLTQRFIGPEAAQHYLAFALNPEQCRDFSAWLRIGNISGSRIDTKSDYDKWLRDTRAYIADFSDVTVYRAS